MSPAAEQEAPTAGTALAGVTVLELSQGIAGPYGTSLLSALGASVVKLEPLDGDWQRGLGPPWAGPDGAAAAMLARGKSSLALDLASPRAPQVIARFLPRVDVVVHDLVDARADALGLAPADLDRAFPRLVSCSVTELGPAGPWAGRAASELEIQGIAGVTRYLGQLGGEPTRLGADVAGVLGGCATAQAVLAALFERLESGLGQAVAVSQAGALYAVSSIMLAALDEPDVWEGFHCNAATAPADHGIPTRDGVVLYGQPLRSEDAWKRFCVEIGAEDLLARPEFATRELRQPRIPELRRALEPYFAKYDTAELLELVAATEGIAVPLNTYGALVEHDQVAALGILRTAADGSPVLAPPWRFTGPGTVSVAGPVPAVGEHTVACLREFGLGEPEIADLLESGVVAQRAGA